MPRRTLLELHRACSLQSLLEALVCCTNERQGSHDPQVTALQPVTAQPDQLPAFINARDCKVGLIYGADASASWPAGDVLLWIRFRPVPGHGNEQDGLHRGQVIAHVWQNENYPLSPKEVEWFIANYCDCTGHDWRQLPLCWQKLQEICEEDPLDEETTPGTVYSSEAISSPPNHVDPATLQKHTRTRRRQGAPHREGKPRMATTRWLQSEIAVLPDINRYDHLYPIWLETYWQETGAPPRNPYNSFKQTADSCIERILADRTT